MSYLYAVFRLRKLILPFFIILYTILGKVKKGVISIHMCLVINQNWKKKFTNTSSQKNPDLVSRSSIQIHYPDPLSRSSIRIQNLDPDPKFSIFNLRIQIRNYQFGIGNTGYMQLISCLIPHFSTSTRYRTTSCVKCQNAGRYWTEMCFDQCCAVAINRRQCVFSAVLVQFPF